MGFLDKIRQGLKKTKEGIFGQIDNLFKSFKKVDEDLFEELEELLIMADCGANTAAEICKRLRDRVKKNNIKEPSEVRVQLEDVITEMLEGDYSLKLETKPSVILVIGVNGVGKTTTIGKLCARFKAEGKKCLIAAADTFRAAAIDQLDIWAQRSGCDIVKHSEGSDPAAVVFDAASAAKARGADILIIDTAGRLHNKKYLMDELAKIGRVLDRELGDCDREVLLVLDATTGQNAVNQARAFKDTAGLTGIVLTKLDGTARGGVVIAIKEELGVPVKFIGVGEQIDDLQLFEPHPFARALFERPEDEMPEVDLGELSDETEEELEEEFEPETEEEVDEEYEPEVEEEPEYEYEPAAEEDEEQNANTDVQFTDYGADTDWRASGSDGDVFMQGAVSYDDDDSDNGVYEAQPEEPEYEEDYDPEIEDGVYDISGVGASDDEDDEPVEEQKPEEKKGLFGGLKGLFRRKG